MMQTFQTRLSLVFHTMMHVVVLITFCVISSFSQTAPNTEIRNQAKAVYQYKSFPPDTIVSASVIFNVLESPNFELSFGARDTVVFGKETLQVRLVYHNIGNKTADSAVIEGVLPPAGLRFVPGSTGGIISGNSVTWVVRNVAAGKSDSVSVKMVVDSTVPAFTQLQVDASISWQSSLVSVSKTFVVNSFPRLEITNTPLALVVGSGRTMSYRIVVKNTGNIQSTNTKLIDTISALGAYVSSNIPPDSVKNSQRIVVWNLGTIAAFSEKEITVTVATPPNLSFAALSNSAFTYSTNVPNGALSSVTNQIVPLPPRYISITTTPLYIFGQLLKDSTRIDVVLKDSIQQFLPDGVPVQLTTTLGTFSNNTQTITTVLNNGVASAWLRSANVANEIQRVKITAVGGVTLSGTIQDTANVFMYPGAVTGIVVSGINRIPYKGAIARVFNSANVIVGADTTKDNGRFFVPLNKDIMRYLLQIFVIDKFGDTITTSVIIDPSSFPMPPIEIPNTIAGRILYRISGLPVPAEGVTVFLDSLSGAGTTSRRPTGVTLPSGIYYRIQEQKTDRFGRFKFENLKPARYVLSLDSTQFPSFKGYNFVSDTVAGTFTIDVSIEIEQDSSVALVMTASNEVNAGDTLRYTTSIENIGNVAHYNVALIDTLPPFTTLRTVQKGNFTSVTFDTATRVVRWMRDSLTSFEKDSVQLTVQLARNIPDSTVIRNAVWYSSNFGTILNSVTTTRIRSSAITAFGNFFAKDSAVSSLVAGDSLFLKIWYNNTGTDSLRNVVIIDTLRSAGYSVLSFLSQNDSVRITDSIITIFPRKIGVIPPGHADTITIKVLTDFSLKTGTKILSRSWLLENSSVVATATAELTMIDNPNLSQYLKITKTGNKKVAEIGDIVTYQIQISNSSPSFVRSLVINDWLPHAFRYVKHSARYNGKIAEPLLDKRLNSLTWNLPDTIRSGNSGTLVYQVTLGADALESEGVNTAYAAATSSVGAILLSAPSQWSVTVRPGVFTEKGLIIGKVFYDDNRNTFQEVGENGIQDVEIWMEDGTKIITGDDGKFSLPEVKPGQHVLRINERTLPPGTKLLPGNNKFARDASSQFVRVTEGGIAKANFYVQRNLKDSIAQLVGRVSKLTAVRQAVPTHIYYDTLNHSDTVTFYVSFVLCGQKNPPAITIREILPSAFSIIANCGFFEDKTIVPQRNGDTVIWNLGSSKRMTRGVLRYKAQLNKVLADSTILYSSSILQILLPDSTVFESDRLTTKNIIGENDSTNISTSNTISKLIRTSDDSSLNDTLSLYEGDEVFFKTMLYIDPKKKISSIKLVDTLDTYFTPQENSYTINGIPIPSKNLTINTHSLAISALRPFTRNEVEVKHIATVDITDLVRQGVNEIKRRATVHNIIVDTTLKKSTYAVIVNTFNEVTTLKSQEAVFLFHQRSKVPPLHIETTYIVVKWRPKSLQKKIAEATKALELLKESEVQSVVLEGITFKQNSAVLTEEAMVILNNIAKILKENPKLKIQIHGHTDSIGNAIANQRMSLARARAVRTYLMKKGIAGKRLVALGFGFAKPIATNSTEEGRAKNRRVEFVRQN